MRPTLKFNSIVKFKKINLWISLPLSMLLGVLLSMLCLAANASAATTATASTSTAAVALPAATSTVAAPKKAEPPALNFGFSYDVSYTMQAQAQTDKDGAKSRAQSLGHEFSPSLSYGEYKAFAYMGYGQDLVDTTSNSWSDLVLGAGKKAWDLGSYFKLGPSLSAVLPLKDSTRSEVGLLYAFGGALKLSLNTEAIGIKAFKISYQGQLSRNNLQFDTNAKTGDPNKLYGYRNRIDASYDITDAFSISARFDFTSNYSVNGVVSNTFASSQSLGYSFNDNASVSFSHGNEGSYLKTGTYENNLKFFNSETSEYSLGLSLSI